MAWRRSSFVAFSAGRTGFQILGLAQLNPGFDITGLQPQDGAHRAVHSDSSRERLEIIRRAADLDTGADADDQTDVAGLDTLLIAGGAKRISD